MAIRHRKTGTSTPPITTDTQGVQLGQAVVPDDGDGTSLPTDDDDGDETEDPYLIVPLVERSVWLRLDVGPFLCAYLGMGLLLWPSLGNNSSSSLNSDNYNNIDDDDDTEVQLVWWTKVAFGIVLAMHLTLVLWSQWSVVLSALVGYHWPAVGGDDSISTVRSSDMVKEVDALTMQTMRQWTHCLVQASQTELDGSSPVAGIVSVKVFDTKNYNCGTVATISFHDMVFRCCSGCVWGMPDLDVTLWKQSGGDDSTMARSTTRRRRLGFQPLKYPVQLPLTFYAYWRGHATMASCIAASTVYGRNTTALALPSFWHLLAAQTVAPFFLFQVFCVVLWSLDEYWYYAMFTLFALIMFESTLAYNRLKSLERLHAISHKNQYQRVWVRRGGATSGTDKVSRSWMSVSVHELVPGDWISLSGSHVAVPADVLLLHGNAVCDEALLTGESVPQLKQPLDMSSATVGQAANDTDAPLLDIQHGEYKESILFGGTVLVVGTPPQIKSASGMDNPPDDGISGIVLRTGFETAQGNLLRTMAHSSKSADSVHTVDTFVFILLLIICAIGAAAHVLHEGWYDERRNRFRLVLHVVIIITSVVPPELPMELSLAVTNSVAALMQRCQVFCTEHFRIPWAGEVDVCCFDKTGTLTSDDMRLRGVRLFGEKFNADIKEEDDKLVLPMEKKIPIDSMRVMAACHSLAVARTVGGNRRSTQLKIIGDPLEETVLKHAGYELLGNNVVAPKSLEGASECKKMSILHRFAFSSKLKRMTVLASEEGGKGSIWALSKGAPETIRDFLTSASIPDDYDDVSLYHMRRGRRVLAMAYRELGNSQSIQTIKEGGREQVESGLTFAGFLVLDCPLKPDSKAVISELKKSGHRVVMITGDAILTAAEVARQVGIVRRSSTKHTMYKIQKRTDEVGPETADPLIYFECKKLGSSNVSPESLDLSSKTLDNLLRMKKLGQASFCISGYTLVEVASAAVKIEKDTDRSYRGALTEDKHLLLSPVAQTILKQLVPLISVFARHAPHQKEAVVAAFNNRGFQTLMCGDGTNDVGALKRAHVGISIISAPGVESKQREASETIMAAHVDEKDGGKKATKKKKTKSLEESLRRLREAQDELEHVELGDASVAAPFTSRAVSIKCCKDVIQQGRCTLVTMLTIYKILGINCLVNALVLSKLFLHGVKQGDRQLTILGLVVAALFFFVTRAEPLSNLSTTRPPASVLCVEAILSIAGQFCIHLAAIILATEAALMFVDPWDPSLVPDGPFNPNCLNTCTFLLTCLATINTFAANYRGRPFMKDLRENKLFYRSLQVSYAVLVICALEIFPPLNDLMQLTALPSVADMASDAKTDHPIVALVRVLDFPFFMTALMALDTLLTFAFERFVMKTFQNN